MNWVFGFVVYALIWWLTLFIVLPFGVRRDENPAAGHDPGAPAHPHLWAKVAVTTAIATVLWLIAVWLIKSPWLSFRT
jgi:predicted secreted protein